MSNITKININGGVYNIADEALTDRVNEMSQALDDVTDPNNVLTSDVVTQVVANKGDISSIMNVLPKDVGGTSTTSLDAEKYGLVATNGTLNTSTKRCHVLFENNGVTHISIASGFTGNIYGNNSGLNSQFYIITQSETWGQDNISVDITTEYSYICVNIAHTNTNQEITQSDMVDIVDVTTTTQDVLKDVASVEYVDSQLGIIVYSSIFSGAKRAWGNNSKLYSYEAWPWGNCWFDTSDGTVNLVYNSRTAHITTTSAVLFRKKYPIGNFGNYTIISDSTNDSIGKRCHGSGMDKNGNYLALVIFQRSDLNNNDGYVHVFRSTNKGTTWTDEGAISIGGTDITVGEAGSCFLCSNGRLLSFMSKPISGSGVSYSHIVYSDDNGETWSRATPYDNTMEGLEGSFVEIDNVIYVLIRKGFTGSTNKPIMWKSTDFGSTWTFVGETAFGNRVSPTSIIYLKDDEKIMLIGGDRLVDYDGYCSVRMTVIQKNEFVSNTMKFGTRIMQATTGDQSDFGYVGACISPDNVINAFFYMKKDGSTNIWQMVGSIL